MKKSFYTSFIAFAYLLCAIGGTVIHFITVYICSASFGFLIGLLSFCFPFVSELLLLFDYVLSGDMFNMYCIILYIYIIIMILAIIFHYKLENT